MTTAHSLARLSRRATLRQHVLPSLGSCRSFIVTTSLRPHYAHQHPLQRLSPARPKLTLTTRCVSSHSNPLARSFRSKLPRPVSWSLAAAITLVLLYLDERRAQPLYPDTFTRFTIVSREQTSPTAFVLTVSASGPNLATNLWGRLPWAGEPRFVTDNRAATVFNQISSLGWTWSLEVKQPQLQVSREYTPLPPLAAVEGEGKSEKVKREAALRFLIRKYDKGEVSSYLSSLRVGDEIEIRGPHYGFAVKPRLLDAERLVFLAGGTGIAPALQVVKALVGEVDNEDGMETMVRPKVDILWANRQRADCPNCPGLNDAAGDLAEGKGGPILDQLAEIQRRYPGRVSVRCTVDEEGSFVQMGALAGLVTCHTAPRVRDDKEDPGDCRLHSQAAVAVRPATDDGKFLKNEGEEVQVCSCRQGKNLLFVSGPDGFVKAYAGPKRWANGMQLQGPVGGILGQLKARYPEAMKDWLVLKL